ncbi:hypothetical protein F5Y19DRAFT_406623 [Xylariaceae sp. FL1651]|nr:hypothetical protein F5Y19DRAFT_406623 [Xylariaceae sp. FL1651]
MPRTTSERRQPHWNYLPPEIRTMILKEICNINGSKLSGPVTVSREWQAVLEPQNFSRITLTPRRLRNLESMVHRNKSHMRYLWFSFELQRYSCAECEGRGQLTLTDEDNKTIAASLEDLFLALSKFDPMGELILDISVHSPSDSEHWFKELTFGPDDNTPGELGIHRAAKQLATRQGGPTDHEWSITKPGQFEIEKLFQDVMAEAPFGTDEEEYWWWQQLPAVPAVTFIILRQQNRRRWKPNALPYMFARFPRLHEIAYEPWREWDRTLQGWTDNWYRLLFESLAGASELRRITLFENFDERYSPRCDYCDPTRIPDPSVSEAIAKASLKLEHLSASFIADASHFFDVACKPSFKWSNLTSLVLTSQSLTPDEDLVTIYALLSAAATAASNMPQTRTMEIWNGRRGLAGLFRYQLTERHRSAIVTWRGTWSLTLLPQLRQVWEAVALKHGGSGCCYVEELLNVQVKCHGDAVFYLQLAKPVLRPISLQQIRAEHGFKEEAWIDE